MVKNGCGRMTDVDVTSIAMGWGLLSRYRVASVFSACEHLEQGMGDPEASSVSCVPMTNQSDICDLVFRVEGEAWEEVFVREERSSWVRIPLWRCPCSWPLHSADLKSWLLAGELGCWGRRVHWQVFEMLGGRWRGSSGLCSTLPLTLLW